MAHAGWRADCLYDNTPWKAQVNAYAGYGPNACPAVRILGDPTLNWHVTTDGRIHMGGKQKKVDVALPAMRRAFVEYSPGQTEHTKYTGMGHKSPEDVEGGAGQVQCHAVEYGTLYRRDGRSVRGWPRAT